MLREEPGGNGGLFVAVVGPSGAGKDTLIVRAREALRGDPRFVFVRRTVTRPSGPHEDHDSLDEAGFAARERAGGFALAWRAHGLGYGVPREVADLVAGGRVAACNLSRRALPDARAVFGRVACVLVTAPPAVLAARIAARGRDAADPSRRPGARNAEPDAEPDAVIHNEGTPEEGGAALADALRRLAGGNGPNPGNGSAP